MSFPRCMRAQHLVFGFVASCDEQSRPISVRTRGFGEVGPMWPILSDSYRCVCVPTSVPIPKQIWPIFQSGCSWRKASSFQMARRAQMLTRSCRSSKGQRLGWFWPPTPDRRLHGRASEYSAGGAGRIPMLEATTVRPPPSIENPAWPS